MNNDERHRFLINSVMLCVFLFQCILAFCGGFNTLSDISRVTTGIEFIVISIDMLFTKIYIQHGSICFLFKKNDFLSWLFHFFIFTMLMIEAIFILSGGFDNMTNIENAALGIEFIILGLFKLSDIVFWKLNSHS